MKKIKIHFTFILLTVILSLTSSCSSDSGDNNQTTATLPQITTNPAQNIGGNYARLGGNITSDGGSEIYLRGICWGTSIDPVRNNNNYLDESSSQLGSFSLDVSNFLPNVTYYFRAYCINEVGIQYGNSLTFTTTNLVTTLSATDILTKTATLKGNVNQLPTETRWVGFVYATTANPTINNVSVNTLINGSDNYQIEITGLTHNTVYYFRTYTEESGVYIYGEQKQFRTTGYTGLAGGYVAYDKGEVNDGWRYLEIHPTLLTYPSTLGAFWGESGFIAGLSDQFGTGVQNTQIISSNVVSANCAAKLCNNLIRNGFSDWFLPSKDEAILIANSLKGANIIMNSFWTSSQFNTNNAYYISSSGSSFQVETRSKGFTGNVFPVRRY